MSTALVIERIAEVSPRPKARLAAFYLFSLLTVATAETFLHGDLFKPENRSLSLLAAFFSLVGLTFEALRLQPRGVNIAIVFAGFYCILIGYLIFRSTFLPRILGALMALAGLGWLTFLVTPLETYLSPFNLAVVLLGELSVFLWLLVRCVNVERQHCVERLRIAGCNPQGGCQLL